MAHADLLEQLLIPGSYTPTEPNLAAQLQAEGNALDAAQASAQRVLGAITPYGAGEMIADWERVLGLTPAVGAMLQQRIDAAITKIRQIGGLSIPYFTQLAATLGYTINIDEPQPFRAGTSRCGDPLYIPDIIYVWKVTVHGASSRSYYFRTGTSAVGEPLLAFADPVIETVFNDLKPAHTFVYFAYL